MRQAPTHRESAFTMIELLVVLLIVAVLIAVVIGSFTGAKSSGGRSKAIAAAQSYDQAISSFIADHSGRVPIPGNASDWPMASLTRGPLEPSLTTAPTGAPYLRSVPEPVSDGSIVLTTTAPVSGSAVAPGSMGTLFITTNGGALPTQYRIDVYPGRGGKLAYSCSFGTMALPTGGKPCS